MCDLVKEQIEISKILAACWGQKRRFSAAGRRRCAGGEEAERRGKVERNS
jgi:hypothetical protein